MVEADQTCASALLALLALLAKRKRDETDHDKANRGSTLLTDASDRRIMCRTSNLQKAFKKNVCPAFLSPSIIFFIFS